MSIAGPVPAPNPTAPRANASEARRTLRWEVVRASFLRPAQLAAQGSGVLLLVAIQHYHATGTAKAVLTAAVYIGMLLAPFVVTVVTRQRWAVSRSLAGVLALSAVGLLVAGAGRSFTPFLVGVLIGAPLLEASTPLVTSLWQRNIPRAHRGRLFGVVGSIAGVAGIAGSLAIAQYMGADASRYRPAVIGLALGVAVAAVAAGRIPAHPLGGRVRNPVQQLRLLVEHRTFGYLIVVWFLLGLGNLATVPLRVEYVASPDYGLNYSARLALVLVTVIPQGVALFATLLWGRWFDRFDFLWERLAINAAFMASIILYFHPSLEAQVAGSIMFGLAMGGGQIAWSLWVTKYAPPDRTADYMAVHTFLTGVRGLIAPFLAYEVLARYSLQAVNAISLALLGTASVMLFPLIWHERRARRSPSAVK